MRQIKPHSARLEVFDAQNKSTTPDFTIPGEKIISPTLPTTLGPLKDQAKFKILSQDGEYTTGSTEITTGDRVEFYVGFGPTYTVGHPDPATETDDSAVRRHTGVVRAPEVEIGMNETLLNFTSEDFVGFVLANRTVEAGFQNRQIAGTSESIVESLLSEYVPEIGLSQIASITTNASITHNAEKLLKAIRRVLARADVVISSDGRDIVVEPLSAVTTEFDLGPEDWAVPLKMKANDDLLSNQVRLDGGEAVAVGSEQTNQSAWTTVTETTRLSYRIDMPKDEVTQVELWTDPTRTASGDGVVLRLQRDKNDAPADIENNQLDFARRTLAADFLEQDGYTTFLLPGHDIVDHRPWLIIEADGKGDGTGQDIGTNSTSDPTYRAGYPYPVSSRADDQASIDDHRRRDRQVSDESIHSLREAAQEAESILDAKNVLVRTVTFDALSQRAHELQPMDGVRIDNREAGVNGDYTVVKRKDDFDGTNQRITTSLELQDIETL